MTTLQALIVEGAAPLITSVLYRHAAAELRGEGRSARPQDCATAPPGSARLAVLLNGVGPATGPSPCRFRWFAPLLALALFTSACANGDGASPSTTLSGGERAWVACRNIDDGWRAEYPEGWRVNDGEVMPPCSLFHPASFTVSEASEIPVGIAVQLRVEDVPVDELLDSPNVEELDRREVSVDGHDGYRQEQRHTGEGLYPEGLRTVRYVVDLGERSLVASTHDAGDPDLDTRVEVLDEMMGRLRLDPPADDGDGDGDGDGDDGVKPLGEATMEAKIGDGFPAAGPEAHLVDVRVGTHDGFDRVVLELEGPEAPSWQVDWASAPITADPSGRELQVDGDAFLLVSVHPATAVDLSGDEPRETYQGPERLSLDGGLTVTEVVLHSDHHGGLSWVIGLEEETPFAVTLLNGPSHRLVIDVVADDEDEEAGQWVELPEAPIEARLNHSATWSGEWMLVWGGGDAGGVETDGAAWKPEADDWRALPAAPIEARWGHVAFWTGDRLLVWGGTAGPDHLATCFTDGALYDPGMGTWAAIPPAPGPEQRCGAAAVWSGSELLVHGGYDAAGPPTPGSHLADGAAFDPSTGEWRTIPTGPLSPRSGAVAAWTGTEFVIVGGSGDDQVPQADAAAYDPETDRWRDAAEFPLEPRTASASVWTGEQLVVIGGRDVTADPVQDFLDGGAYDPADDTWSPVPDAPVAIQTEAVWGDGIVYLVGGPTFVSWEPGDEAWAELPDVPGSPRVDHSAVWAGYEVLVWGGQERADGPTDAPPFAAWRPNGR